MKTKRGPKPQEVEVRFPQTLPAVDLNAVIDDLNATLAALERPSWEKSVSGFNPKTDLLVIPKDDEAFVEMALTNKILAKAMDSANETGTLVPVRSTFRPAIVRTG